MINSPLQHDFALDPIILPFDFHFDFFFKHLSHDFEKTTITQCIVGDDLHINKQRNIFIANQATKRENVPTKSWRGKSAVFLM
jgi:hypothetical protein